jgi:hypothetical protein
MLILLLKKTQQHGRSTVRDDQAAPVASTGTGRPGIGYHQITGSCCSAGRRARASAQCEEGECTAAMLGSAL